LPYQTFGELKYSLFHLYTNDFHNDLYGFVWDYVLSDKTLCTKHNMQDIDNFIADNNVEKKYN
jgi:hypothetical protein